MRRRVVILGSTGSVGTSTLVVIAQHPELFEVVGLSCGSSVDKLSQQVIQFSPKLVSVSDSQALGKSHQFPWGTTKVISGPGSHVEMVRELKPDVLISSMSGTHGLAATLEAVRMKTPVVGVANKEILVMAGPFINATLDRETTTLVPVDSEHSAIFQCLQGNRVSDVSRIILTASGGPFRTRSAKTFAAITPQEALKHPNWVMGAKITIDSATLMNKGLEFIEAVRLFPVPASKIEVIVHPESIIHSLVEYCDGSHLAQLGISDMKIPISYALQYPQRLPLQLEKKLDLAQLKSLTFEAPDFERFPCLKLAMDSEAVGAVGPIVLNAANEIAVELFLGLQISFTDIPRLIEEALAVFSHTKVSDLKTVIDLDLEVKLWARDWKPLAKAHL